MGREVGGGFRMGDTCTPMADSCQRMAKPPQYCKVISLQLKINLKKELVFCCIVCDYNLIIEFVLLLLFAL